MMMGNPNESISVVCRFTARWCRVRALSGDTGNPIEGTADVKRVFRIVVPRKIRGTRSAVRPVPS